MRLMSWGAPKTAINFSSGILRLAAPTLEELLWDSSDCTGLGGVKHSFGPEPLLFPRLRSLALKGVLMADETILSALLPPAGEKTAETLTELSLARTSDQMVPFLAHKGHIATLRRLTWRICIDPNDEAFLSFISENPQLQSIHLVQKQPATVLEGLLIPLFASRFRSLTSLVLVWQEKEISLKSLDLIGQIHSLKRLFLGIGFRSEWRIDHSVFRRKLKALKNLEWFALNNDWYSWGSSRQDGTSIGHCTEMVGHALVYALAHPKLEWVFLGQIPVCVFRDLGRGGCRLHNSHYFRVEQDNVIAAALTESKVEFWELWREMWGACSIYK